MEGFLTSIVLFVSFVVFVAFVAFAVDAVGAVGAAGTGDRESVNFPKTSENRGRAHPPIREMIEEKMRRIFSGGVASEKNLKKETGGEGFIKKRNIYLENAL